MKGKKGKKYLQEQLNSFCNKDEKGLFTFYLQSQHPKSNKIVSINTLQQQSTNPSMIMSQENQNQCQQPETHAKIKCKRNRPEKLKTQSQSSQIQNEYPLGGSGQKCKNRLITISSKELKKIKEIFNFKKQSRQKILQQLLTSKDMKKKKVSLNSISPKQRLLESIISPTYHIVDQYRNFKSNIKDPSRNFVQKQQNLNPQKFQHDKKTDIQVIPIVKNGQTLIQQLQTIQHNQQSKFRPIIFPFKRYRKSYFLKEPLLINNRLLNKQRISSNLSHTPKSKNLDEDFNALDQKALKMRFRKERQSFLDKIQTSLLRSLEKNDEHLPSINSIQVFKDRASNLLKKRSNHNEMKRHRVPQIHTRNSISYLEPIHKTYINQTQNVKPQSFVSLKNSQQCRIKSRILKVQNCQTVKNETLNKKIDKREFLSMVQKIKKRYQSI